MSHDHTDPFMDQGHAGPAGPASPHQNRAEELLARMTHTIQEVDTTLPPEERRQVAANIRQGLNTWVHQYIGTPETETTPSQP